MTPERIRQLRKRRGWTQQKLAEVIGVAVSSVARWESRAGRPPKGASLRTLERLVEEEDAYQKTTSQGLDASRTPWPPDGELHQAVVAIMADMKCAKRFTCAASGFQQLCRARKIGLESHLECLEEDGDKCQFSTALGTGYLCECPLRVYLYRKLNR